jgi:secreted trypsin-like serine protease
MVDWNLCSDAYIQATGGYSGRLTSNQFCAGTKNGTKDACQGDSGGPYTCREEVPHKVNGVVRKNADGTKVMVNKYYQLGIVSFGDSCGKAGSYGQYAKVVKYFDWIKKIATEQK